MRAKQTFARKKIRRVETQTWRKEKIFPKGKLMVSQTRGRWQVIKFEYMPIYLARYFQADVCRNGPPEMLSRQQKHCWKFKQCGGIKSGEIDGGTFFVKTPPRSGCNFNAAGFDAKNWSRNENFNNFAAILVFFAEVKKKVKRFGNGFASKKLNEYLFIVFC